MISTITIRDNQIQETSELLTTVQGKQFPLFCIGRGSYMWNAHINTGIQFTISKGYAVHNLHIGNYVSIGGNVEFSLGRSHNTKALALGVIPGVFGATPIGSITYRQKGQILIQNDVWIGDYATIMPGIVLHNGAVIAAKSHVVKDVPPMPLSAEIPPKSSATAFPRISSRNCRK